MAGREKDLVESGEEGIVYAIRKVRENEVINFV